MEGLGSKKPKARTFWNKIPDEVKDQVVCEALEQTNLSPRELACLITDTKEHFISESSVYRILKGHDLITSPAYILWKLFNSMTASDVKETLDEAVSNTGVNYIQVKHRPRVLSDNGPCLFRES